MLQFFASETLLCVDYNDCFVLYNACAWCGVMNQMCYGKLALLYVSTSDINRLPHRDGITRLPHEQYEVFCTCVLIGSLYYTSHSR